MPETISCPQCQRKLRLPATVEGQTVQCPACQATFIASLAGPAPTLPAEPEQQERFARDPIPAELPPPSRVEYPPLLDDDLPPRRPRYADYIPPDRYRFAHRGSTVLTLGVLSLLFALFCPLVGAFLGILAGSMGGADLSQIRNGVMDPRGEGTTLAGQICGLFGIGISLVAFCAGFLRFNGFWWWWWLW
jgi:hypothetical protein